MVKHGGGATRQGTKAHLNSGSSTFGAAGSENEGMSTLGALQRGSKEQPRSPKQGGVPHVRSPGTGNSNHESHFPGSGGY